MQPNQEQIDLLTRINLDDMLVSFGWSNWPPADRAARLLFRTPARQFARLMVHFDRDVVNFGLRAGSCQFLPVFSKGLLVRGQENIPVSGPLMVVSNHPGMADTIALFSSIPRPDLHVIGNDRPFLRALPALSQYMLFVPEQAGSRLQVVRDIIQVLSSGDAVLTFPAGHIEPDPAVLPGAVEALDDWSESIALFIRKVPNLVIVGAVVSQVLAPQATYHLLTHLRRQKLDRERLGAALQLISVTLFPKLWTITTEITYLPPLLACDLIALHTPRAITDAVTSAMRPHLAAASRL